MYLPFYIIVPVDTISQGQWMLYSFCSLIDTFSSFLFNRESIIAMIIDCMLYELAVKIDYHHLISLSSSVIHG